MCVNKRNTNVCHLQTTDLLIDGTSEVPGMIEFTGQSPPTACFEYDKEQEEVYGGEKK